jgi:mannan endo-1,4-beta-mannosidase
MLAVLAVACLGLAPGTAGARAGSRDGAHASSAPAIGVGAGRRISPANRCAIASRAKVATASRKRLARRLRRSCRRGTAAGLGGPSGPLYWGAWIGDQLTGGQAPWDMSAVSKFEQMTGKPMSLIHFSAPFADCSSSCSFYKFPTSSMQSIRDHGSIPFFSWASQATPASIDQPDFQLSDVIAGRYDSYIREFAEGARDWGHPFFLRFNWEMNGNWFEWSEGVNGNQPGEYVAAWRHVHDIFTQVGATNATWVWCPNVDPENQFQDLSSLYPGDAYVDWTGLDGYNSGTDPARSDHWRTFDQLYADTYQEITEEIAPTKPLVIAEVSSSEQGGSKAAWIDEALSSIPAQYSKVGALLWFEKYDSGMDWPIETSSAATSAFASAIQNPIYQGNSYSNLDASPIPVAH